mmetsp:Transcript_126978/g.367580  ORF Transcript_126978/g.367580 Transcript_126978/m.367580 type:complete len:314 (-) Transcript_126978:562-1503(-)
MWHARPLNAERNAEPSQPLALGEGVADLERVAGADDGLPHPLALRVHRHSDAPAPADARAVDREPDASRQRRLQLAHPAPCVHHPLGVEDDGADLVHVHEVRPALLRQVRVLRHLVELRERQHREALGDADAQEPHRHVDLGIRRGLTAKDIGLANEEVPALRVQQKEEHIALVHRVEGGPHRGARLGLLQPGRDSGAERIDTIKDLLLAVVAELCLDLVDQALPDQLRRPHGLGVDPVDFLLEELGRPLLLLLAKSVAIHPRLVDHPGFGPTAAQVHAQQSHGQVPNELLCLLDLCVVLDEGVPTLVHDAAG